MMHTDGRNTFLMAGLNGDIITCWKKCYEQFKEQPRDIITPEVRNAATVDEKCQAIFGYMVTNTRYMVDRDGEQLIKSPARLIADGVGDCKSYTMFIASCLHCLGIPCKVRFVNFDGGSQYTHVYPVAIDEQGNEIPMDACELDEDGTPLYDFARRYMKKKELYYV
ncbi:transglutaminase domain-containing protein [Methanocorpusculum sp.]|nr:transglutaminase domain-containing protein [Methanocorpusculum sp.]